MTTDTRPINAPKAVLFDLDGTLIDTAPDFVRIIKLMCAKYKHPCPTDDAIREQVSAGAKAMIRLIFGELANIADDDPVLLSYRQEFLDLYEADICVDSRLFDGLDEFLADLEVGGISWGIVTNKPRYLAQILLEKLSLTKRCSVLVCPDDVARTKPDPEPMLLACQHLGVEPADCVYIGDHIRDIQAGQAAGMTTFAAAYGYIPPKEFPIQLWGADKVVHDVGELISSVHAWLQPSIDHQQ